FLLLPAQLAYEKGDDPGLWQALFDWNRHIVLNYNLVPSLHVAMSAVALAAYARGRGLLGKALLAAWGMAIALSTLLVHEHHVVAVAAGALLGWWGYVMVFLPRLARAQQIVPSSPASAPTVPV